MGTRDRCSSPARTFRICVCARSLIRNSRRRHTTNHNGSFYHDWHAPKCHHPPISKGTGYGGCALSIAFAGLFGMFSTRPKKRVILFVTILLGGIVGLSTSGCGSGSSGSTNLTQNSITTAVTINATSGNITQSQQIQLTIPLRQPRSQNRDVGQPALKLRPGPAATQADSSALVRMSQSFPFRKVLRNRIFDCSIDALRIAFGSVGRLCLGCAFMVFLAIPLAVILWKYIRAIPSREKRC